MKLFVGLLIAGTSSLLFSAQVFAVTTSPTQPFPTSSPLIITTYSVGADLTSLDFVQVYNNSNDMLVLDGWQLAYTTTLSTNKVNVVSLHGYMLPESHYVLTLQGGLSGDGVSPYDALALLAPGKLKSLVLVPPDTATTQSEQPIAGAGIYRRNLTTTGYSTSTTFTKQDPLVFTNLAADPLYSVPGTPQLRIVEILPRSADCAPNDTSLVCGDYVKLQNTSNAPYDMSSYRLRTDSSTSESSNAFALDWIVGAGDYFTVHLKDDGNKLSLTDSGGYVWLEDAMGLVAFYDSTMVNYPSASSSTKQGWAWALGAGNEWQWTSTPQPDAQNLITLPPEVISVVSTSDSECPAGKYRNPETNRCKNIEEAIATLVACDEGKYRSPETNRCRSIATATNATLTPCDPGQERNPATNRCRTLGTTTGPGPCPEGQERNPATNRCRKVMSSALPATFADPVSDNKNISSYWLGGAIATAAVGYGAYEWRVELAKLFRKIVPTAK